MTEASGRTRLPDLDEVGGFTSRTAAVEPPPAFYSLGERRPNTPGARNAWRGSCGAVVRLTGFIPVLAVLIVVTVGAVAATAEQLNFASDFRGTIWEPGRAILSSENPYPAATNDGASGQPAVYPPPLMIAALPLAALPFKAAAALWTMLLVAACLAALWAVGVRDWRCWSIALLSAPLLGAAVPWGNATALVIAAAALAWRYRTRTVAVAGVVAAGIVVKLLLWPLLVWLVVTGRRRAAALAAVLAAGVTVVTWAAIGFDGMVSYPALLREVTDVHLATGLGVASGAHALGLPSPHLVAAFTALALLAFASVQAQRADGERRAFALALVAAAVTAPVVWSHYYGLVIVALAVAVPRFTPAWLLLVPLWMGNFSWSGGYHEHRPSGWAIAACLSVAAATGAVVSRGGSRGRPVLAADVQPQHPLERQASGAS